MGNATVLLVTFTFSLLTSLNAVMADQSGWMSFNEAVSFSARLDKEGKLVTAVSCRNSGKAGGGLRQMASVNLTYSDGNPRGVAHAFNIAKAKAVAGLTKKLEGKGYHRVSSSSFTRPRSGLSLTCFVWHK